MENNKRYQIAFERDVNGNYVVRPIDFNGKPLVCLPRFFLRICRVHPRAMSGCLDVSPAIIRQLGWIALATEIVMAETEEEVALCV